MAHATLGIPQFSGNIDEDVEGFIHLFRGFLHGVGVNPLDIAGGVAPGVNNGNARAIGLFHGCLKGASANWYDKKVLDIRTGNLKM